MRLGFGSVLGLVLVVGALGACSSGGSVANGGSGTPPGGKPSVSPSGTTGNRSAAIRDEQSIMASFRPPPGARRLSGRPAGAVGQLTTSDTHEASAQNTVQGTQWWVVTGRPKPVLAALAVPAGARKGGSSYGNGSGGVSYEQDFDWAPVRNVLFARDLGVAGMAVGAKTILRVDADVTWVPVRAASSMVPATATAVTVTYTSVSMVGKPKKFGPVTVTDPAKVRAIIEVINNAQPLPAGNERPCPFDGGANMTLMFRASPDGPPLASASIDPAGCAFGTVEVTGGSSVRVTDGGDLVAAVKSVVNF